jgi:hypothetical protein
MVTAQQSEIAFNYEMRENRESVKLLKWLG